MNEVIKIFCEMDRDSCLIRLAGFSNRVCEPFTKSKERIQKFKETGNLRYTYHKKLVKACFQDESAYGDV